MTSKKTDSDLKLASVGIETGKDVFHVVAFDLGGTLVLRRKIKAIASGDWCKAPVCAARTADPPVLWQG